MSLHPLICCLLFLLFATASLCFPSREACADDGVEVHQVKNPGGGTAIRIRITRAYYGTSNLAGLVHMQGANDVKPVQVALSNLTRNPATPGKNTLSARHAGQFDDRMTIILPPLPVATTAVTTTVALETADNAATAGFVPPIALRSLSAVRTMALDH